MSIPISLIGSTDHSLNQTLISEQVRYEVPAVVAEVPFQRVVDPPTAKYPSTRASDLQPQPNYYLLDWVKFNNSSIAIDRNSTDSAPNNTAGVNFTIDATFGDPNQVGFSADFGSAFADPTALQGPNRSHTVNSQSPTNAEFSASFYIQQKLTPYQRLALELTGDPEELGIDLGYSIKPSFLPGFFSVNFANTRSPVAVFDGGRRKVKLLHDQKPWLHRLGGGIEYFQPFSTNLGAAFGINYQRVSVRNRMFTSEISPRDQLGNPLTFSETGQDSLLTLNLAAFYSTVDNFDNATRGSKLRFGIDQSIPVGNASITYTRLSANATQYIPFNLFGFTQGPRTLVLNLQGGVLFGDVPPYEAFTLGGGDTVRGYDTGAVGSGSRFIQATVEYRFPILNFTVLNQAIQARGLLFFDYGSVLNSERNVLGNPSGVRLKPGDGISYGAGLHFIAPFGLIRVEFGWNDRGGNQFIFDIGDRF